MFNVWNRLLQNVSMRSCAGPPAARIAGFAMRRCNGDGGVPCRRAMVQDGRPCDSRKFSAPLEAEGVNFLPDGRVDMERFYFQPQEEV